MATPELLDNGEDVTRVSVRDLAIRAVNTAILAKQIADENRTSIRATEARIEDAFGQIAKELADVRTTCQAILEVVQKGHAAPSR
jgi:hypothetical protein